MRAGSTSKSSQHPHTAACDCLRQSVPSWTHWRASRYPTRGRTRQYERWCQSAYDFSCSSFYVLRWRCRYAGPIRRRNDVARCCFLRRNVRFSACKESFVTFHRSEFTGGSAERSALFPFRGTASRLMSTSQSFLRVARIAYLEHSQFITFKIECQPSECFFSKHSLYVRGRTCGLNPDNSVNGAISDKGDSG